MAREWKPGDVAMAPGVGTILLRSFDGGWRSARAARVLDFRNVRPLLVIDPEDREQVERLMERFHMGDRGELITNADDMQAALRSLLAPPKPDEPQQYGAVVEDSEGARWIRIEPTLDKPWYRSDIGMRAHWLMIDAVGVLSEGIRP